MKMNKLAAKEEDLIIDAIQLEGSFGKIYMGRFFTKNPHAEVNVIVKTLDGLYILSSLGRPIVNSSELTSIKKRNLL